MGALVLCGVPPEKYWKYTDKKPDFDEEPPSFIYAIAENYGALTYFCHDPLSKNITSSMVSAFRHGTGDMPHHLTVYTFANLRADEGVRIFIFRAAG